MKKFVIGQKVIKKDMVNRDTDHPEIVDVICTIVVNQMPENSHPCPFDYWIDNPARGYIHAVAEASIKAYVEDKLPHSLDEHLDNIDAAVFSGDTFMNTCAIIKLQEYIDRWQSEISSNLAILKALEDE